MEKLQLGTQDGTEENVERLSELFPQVVTEVQGEDSQIKRAIDFDALRDLLGDVAEGQRERYQFTWPGKTEAKAEARRPIAKTMRPQKDKSVNWDTTENLYIEGDNLDALKILKETYAGKVKLIYIDPPYNTGHDFVYDDDYAKTRGEYDAESGEFDEEGGRLVANTEGNGRFHSDWCSMMYPRLMLARDLLSADGAIFISIDDNEVNNLKKLCDEIFGDANFIVTAIWKKRSTPPNDQVIGAAHEYIVMYAKDSSTVSLNLRKRSAEQLSKYKNPDNHPKGPWASGDLSANVKGGRYVASLNFPIINPNTGEEHYPPHNGNWRYNKDTIAHLLANDEIYFGADGKGRPKLKRFLCDVKQGITYTSLWDFVPLNTQGSVEMSQLLGNIAVFDNPKPVGLISELCKLGLGKDDVVLDFFSGSGTCAQSIMDLNANDGGSRKFILVQLPESTIDGSEGKRAGYLNICEIGEERIRRAGAKIASEIEEENRQLKIGEDPKPIPDIGFRVLAIDSSNMRNTLATPEETTQKSLFDFTDNVKEGRTELDLLFEVLPKFRIPYSAQIEEIELGGKHCFTVNENQLVACFDTEVGIETIEEMAKMEPDYAVMRDASMADNATQANFEELFRTYSPDTVRRVI